MGKLKHLALLGIILCVAFTITVSKVASFYKISKVLCEENSDLVDNVSCTVKPISWTRSVLNLQCNLKNSHKEINAKVEVFYKDSSNMFKPFGIKLNFDICQLLDRKKQSHFLEEYAVHHLRTLTNINHSCPISGNIYARDFYFDELSLPPFPLQEYKMIFNFSISKPVRHLGDISVFFGIFENYYKNKRPKPRSKAIIFN